MAPREQHLDPLPPVLATLLQDPLYASLTRAPEQARVLQAPRREIESICGTVPIQLRHRPDKRVTQYRTTTTISRADPTFAPYELLRALGELGGQ